jgi:amino acid adenylation domain-containing protein
VEAALAGIWAEVLGVERVTGGGTTSSSWAGTRSWPAGNPSEGEALALAPFALVSAEDRERMPDTVEDAYPPSLLQLGMLFHGERDPGSAAYHNVSRFVLRAPYQPATLATAVAELVRRHPVLRTSFDGVRFGEPLQLVHREARVSVETGDLRELPAADRERILEERFEAELNSRFAWSRPGLLRFWANALTDETFELGIAEHHAILDGWSVSVLLSELFDLYFAALEGRRPALPEPPDGVFRDFVALERRALGSEESRRFWRERLSGAAPLELPRWPGRPAVSGPAVRKILLAVPADVEARLGRFADSAQVPLKSVLLAAHLRVLDRLGGGPDAMTGLVSNGRPEVQGGDRSLGLFLNTLPLRLRLAGGTWSDLARAAFQAELAAMPHRRVPLAELQSRFGAGRQLFEVTFNYTHFHVLANASGLEIVDAESFAATSFTLAVHFSRSVGQGLVLELQYDAAELWRSQVQAWADFYLRVLDDLSLHPERRWAEGPAPGETERHQAVLEWNDTGAPLRRACLHELVEEQADRAPDAVAVACGEAYLSYRELDLRANRLAHRLRSLGVGPEVLVGLCAERSPELVIGILAVLKAGGAYLPLAPEYPRERLAFLLEDSGSSVLLASRHFARELPAGGLPVVPLDPGAVTPSARSDQRPQGGAGPDGLACVLYTSGSTGRPKGVLVSHGGLANRLLWAQGAYPVTADDRVLHKASFSFDFSVWEVFGPLIAGAQVVLARPGGQGDAPYLAREIRQREVTLVHFIPSMLQAFLAEEGLEGCASLRFLFSGGEALAPELARLCRSRVPAPLRNQYGPTEISIDTTDWVCREEDHALGFVPLGQPLANTAVHVLDGRFEPALPGVSGELLVGGAGVSRGYLRRPDLTAERFLPDPFSGVPGARLYRTGDRALRLPGGGLRFLGRVDLQVKIRGFRIEPGEIESALRADPRVRQAAVVARETAGGDLRLVAYVAGGPEAPAPEELRERLAASLPEFLVPASFVVLPSLPLTPNGKLDRAALPEPGSTVKPAREAVPPRDELELRLAQLWEELLEVRPVGIRDDFFALGGHSLLALRLMGGIERLFGRKIPLSALLEARTVEALARLLRREAEQAPRSPLVRLQAGGSRPALFLVHPVGGDVLCYLPLVRPGVLDGPAFGLQSPSPGMLPEPWTLEALAELYVAALREAQPAGPYLLAGWSMGGMVAFEMARQLEGRGDDVALLMLIDVSPPGQGPQGEDPRLELAAFAADLQGLADLENLGALPEATLDELLEMEEVRARLPPDVDAERLRELFAVFRANRRALGAYRPRRYGGRVTLVHAEATVSAFPAQDFRAWEGLAGAGAEIHVLPGDHYSLLKSSGARVLAELLERCVQGALGARG